MKPHLISASLLAAGVFTPAFASAQESMPAEPGVPAESRPWRVALVAGAGHAYGLLGAHLEVRHSHVAAFIGLGPMPGGPVGAIGVKRFSGEGEGLVGSVHVSYWHAPPREFFLFSDDLSGVDSMLALSATVGWRFRWGDSFLELGIGQTLSSVRRDGLEDGEPVSGRSTGLGALGPGKPLGPAYFPDLALAFGYEF